jgi:hypothetical protein
MSNWRPPTRDGAAAGRDAVSGLAWAFEDPDVHWGAHDTREIRYWRSRPVEERLAQAASYRMRVHGQCPEPRAWTWKFVRFDID